MSFKFLAIAAASLAGCAQAATIYQLAAGTPTLSTLTSLLNAASLVNTFNGTTGSITVFAPQDSAFTPLGANVLDFVTNAHNVVSLQTILTYHANLTLTIMSTSLPLDTTVSLPTADSNIAVNVTRSATGVTVNAAKVVLADLVASNGVVHVIDSVLLPSNLNFPTADIPTLATSVPTLSSLVAALTSQNLVTALSAAGGGIFTVFAPNDAAFAKLPPTLYRGNDLTNVLLYHVESGKRIYSEQVVAASPINSMFSTAGVPLNLTVTVEGSDVYVNGISKVISVDNQASNGAVHIIDTVIATLPLYNVITATPGFDTLERLLVLAGLNGALQGTTPTTVFAPTNAAFSALGANIISWVNASHNKNGLTNILLNHVVPGVAWSRQLTDGMKITTADAGAAQLTVSIAGSVVKIDAATVTAVDANAYQGALHTIDAVLIPSNSGYPTSDIVANAQGSSNLTTLVAKLIEAGLVSTLQSPNGPFTVFAPIDSAFANADPRSIATAAALFDVLTYHVVTGRYYLEDLSNLSTLVTYEGKSVSIDKFGAGGSVEIIAAGGNKASILTTVDCSNGVVHFIDSVLLPVALPTGNGASSTAAFTAFSVAAAGVVAGVIASAL